MQPDLVQSWPDPVQSRPNKTPSMDEIALGIAGSVGGKVGGKFIGGAIGTALAGPAGLAIGQGIDKFSKKFNKKLPSSVCVVFPLMRCHINVRKTPRIASFKRGAAIILIVGPPRHATLG